MVSRDGRDLALGQNPVFSETAQDVERATTHHVGTGEEFSS